MYICIPIYIYVFIVATIKTYTCLICKDETYTYHLSTEEEIRLEMITHAFPTTTAFQQVFPGVPIHIKQVFTGIPTTSN